MLDQHVLNVILQHVDDEQAAEDNSLGCNVTVLDVGQVAANEDVGNGQGKDGSSQCPVHQVPGASQH